MKHLVITLIITVFMTNISESQTFTLRSNDLGGQITNRQLGNAMGCKGDNISPELHWENAPKETQAFAISVYDMDAPTGSGFWHWMVYNIPASITLLKSDAGNFSGQDLPQGAANGNNDAGAPGYVGPCPPVGEVHRYIITVFALKAPIQLEKNASPALTGMVINMNTIAKASLLVYGQQ
ncbi:YbhB/YbcL family Raf kinase inhibitor-like protein [Arcicella lustrica]|uniref:YbhB/YbcL family Raf kinase inhibitor-like protein n=1 Tax=Arcicella lustrica TaxID=2984196 RepID=A0ABU5SPU4_9BACT|nr:YbhB/YbcL family Raf kinase inhibitor-like protein [Arcicella sp. DC25W]MEA5429295.1 YbhB/YbcL family Raf kinase inhibitor-like protein [Arcicella sp. DC25W]